MPPQRHVKGTYKPKTSYNTRTKSVSTLKKKLRDTRRLLTQPSLSAPVRADHERALAAYELELSVAAKSRRDYEIRKKYQMVRFFERQKATRRVKKLEKEHAAGGDVSEDLEDARVELNYTLYFPDGEKYISLFKDPGDAGGVKEKRDEIKNDIKRRMEKGTLGRWTTGDEAGGEEEAVEEQQEEAVESEESMPEKKILKPKKSEKAKTLKPAKPEKSEKQTTEKTPTEKPKERKEKKEKKDGSNKTKRKTNPELVKDTIENDDFFEF